MMDADTVSDNSPPSKPTFSRYNWTLFVTNSLNSGGKTHGYAVTPIEDNIDGETDAARYNSALLGEDDVLVFSFDPLSDSLVVLRLLLLAELPLLFDSETGTVVSNFFNHFFSTLAIMIIQVICVGKKINLLNAITASRRTNTLPSVQLSSICNASCNSDDISAYCSIVRASVTDSFVLLSVA